MRFLTGETILGCDSAHKEAMSIGGTFLFVFCPGYFYYHYLKRSTVQLVVRCATGRQAVLPPTKGSMSISDMQKTKKDKHRAPLRLESLRTITVGNVPRLTESKLVRL